MFDQIPTGCLGGCPFFCSGVCTHRASISMEWELACERVGIRSCPGGCTRLYLASRDLFSCIYLIVWIPRNGSLL